MGLSTGTYIAASSKRACLLLCRLCSEWCLAQLAARYGVTQFARTPFDCKLPGPSKGTLAALVQDLIASRGKGVTPVVERPFRCVSTAPHTAARPAEWLRHTNEVLNNLVHLEEMVRGCTLSMEGLRIQVVLSSCSGTKLSRLRLLHFLPPSLSNRAPPRRVVRLEWTASPRILFPVKRYL